MDNHACRVGCASCQALLRTSSCSAKSTAGMLYLQGFGQQWQQQQ